MTDFRQLCLRMADELDHYRQLLTDDRREVHLLAAAARAALFAQPAITPSLAELVGPHPGYQPGTGREDGAQLVGGEWWAPEVGCDSLDATLEAIRDRIAPYLREPVAGVDVPGPDGDYGGLVELCRAQGVDPELGVPLLQRAQKAWEVGSAPPADGEVEELAQWLYRLAGERTCNRRRGIHPHPSALARAAVLLQQLPPEGLDAIRYSVEDDGAVIQRTSKAPESWAVRRGSYCMSTAGEWDIEPWASDRTDEWLAAHRFPTLAAAWAALQQARRREESDD